jgi:hypothetical protein
MRIMLARLLDTKIKRFGLVLLVLSALPIGYTVVHYQLDPGKLIEHTAYRERAPEVPATKAGEIVLKTGAGGWAVLSRECYESRLKAWRAKNGARPMPLPRDCATSYRLRQTVATKVHTYQKAPYVDRLLSVRDGYFSFLAIAAFIFLTGLTMVTGLFDRVGRWVSWGE